jgi:hypothetical protein
MINPREYEPDPDPWEHLWDLVFVKVTGAWERPFSDELDSLLERFSTPQPIGAPNVAQRIEE